MANLVGAASLAAVTGTRNGGGFWLSRMRATRGVCVSRVRATPGGAARAVCGVVNAARWEKTGRVKASLPLKAIVDRSAAADEETAAFALHSSSASEMMGFENATNEEIDVDATALRTTTIGEFTTERRQQLSVITADAGLVVDTVVASAETNKTQSFQPASKLRSLGAVKKPNTSSAANYVSFRQTGKGGLLGCDRDVTTSALHGVLQRLDKSNRYPVLFFAPEMRDLAEKIAQEVRNFPTQHTPPA
jgi:hypothetical protein